jgi:hypothetical protein
VRVTDLDARMDRIESELAIRRLAAEYCHGADKRDLDRFLAVWAPSAVWQMGDEVRYEGREAIAEVVRAQWATFAQYVHWTTNHSIWIDGDDARGECDVAATVRLHTGRWVGPTGTSTAASGGSGSSRIETPVPGSTSTRRRTRARPACGSITRERVEPAGVAAGVVPSISGAVK